MNKPISLHRSCWRPLAACLQYAVNEGYNSVRESQFPNYFVQRHLLAEPFIQPMPATCNASGDLQHYSTPPSINLLPSLSPTSLLPPSHHPLLLHPFHPTPSMYNIIICTTQQNYPSLPTFTCSGTTRE